MPDYKKNEVAFSVKQNTKLRKTIGRVIQELDNQFILVELENDELGILCVAHLAWLPYNCKLADLQKYFVPTCRLDDEKYTDEEISDYVDTHPNEVVLLYHSNKFSKLITKPDLYGGTSSKVKIIRCSKCDNRVVLVEGLKRCPICDKNF